jgi:hypothetical protein
MTSATLRIPLSRGEFATIDRDDYRLVAQYTWSLLRTGKRRDILYAVRMEAGKMIYLHRFLLEAGPDQHVDHRDRDGLNCCRLNLRVATRTQNNANRVMPKRGNRPYRGVAATRSGKWSATIGLNRKQINIGRFATAEEAARAYDAKALELFGEFAILNFPRGEAAA